MKFIFNSLLLILFCSLAGLPARASSLDELYRDIVRSDNQGYLPMFVKNRSQPDILIEEEVLKKVKDSSPAATKETTPTTVKLDNDRAAVEAARQAALLKWQNTLKAVQEKRVTPLELDEINARISQNDPHAVEVLAWMYVQGVGVERDYLKAFRLYRLAEKLGVTSASQNALLVFKAMTPLQRESLKNR